MTDPMTGAMTLIRNLWPQTAAWQPAVWQSWAAALSDLDPADLMAGIRRASSTAEWPSLAVIRRGALIDRLAPPAAVALQHKEHPLVREVVRECTSWSGLGEMMDFDGEGFNYRYQKAADEWNARLVAGEEVELPGNAAERRRQVAGTAMSAIESGSDPARIFAILTDDVIEELADRQMAWAVKENARLPQARWDEASGEYLHEDWYGPAKEAFREERGKRRGPALGAAALAWVNGGGE